MVDLFVVGFLVVIEIWFSWFVLKCCWWSWCVVVCLMSRSLVSESERMEKRLLIGNLYSMVVEVDAVDDDESVRL